MSFQQTRLALSEIPDRFEDLRLNNSLDQNITTPNNNNDATNPIFNTTLVDNRTNVEHLSQDPNSSIWASPDELVIRQRGRRRLTVWSPEDAAAKSPRSPFQRTPTKLPLTSSMILRSSPRKRLTMGSVPLHDTAQQDTTNFISSPSKMSVRQNLKMESSEQPLPKRLRVGGIEDSSSSCPFVRTNTMIPLQSILQGYSKQQLVDIILQEMVEGRTSVEDQLRSRLPILRLDEYEHELQQAKRNVYKSLPTSRLCKKTDSVAYSRASVYLNEFKRILFQHLKCLHNAALWDTLLDYVLMAWNYVRSTPIWDNAVHNVIRRQCFKALITEVISAIRQANTKLGVSRLILLEKALKNWTIDYEDSVVCVAELNKVFSNKGRISL